MRWHLDRPYWLLFDPGFESIYDLFFEVFVGAFFGELYCSACSATDMLGLGVFEAVKPSVPLGYRVQAIFSGR